MRAKADVLNIAPLLARHAEDAAFYWSQRDGAVQAFLLTPDRLAHFDRLLEAHLDGLETAGQEGLAVAFKALERWGKAGEAFVFAWLLGRHQEEALLAQLSSCLSKNPATLMRGVISALARLPENDAGPLLARWLHSGSPPAEQVAALRALALRTPGYGQAQAAIIAAFLTSPVSHVRAAACRALARLRPNADTSLSSCLHDDDLSVRAEAAIALNTARQSADALAVLWQSVSTQADIFRSASGAFRHTAARRLHRWLRHLACQTPFGHAALPDLFDGLTRRMGLTFMLYHGDPAHLPRIAAAVADPETARYAGWVWQAITGIDLRANGLILREPEFDLDAVPGDAQRDADNGLPLPDGKAIGRQHIQLAPGKRTLLGQQLTPAQALHVLEEHPQALRFIAAHALIGTFSSKAPNVRASVPEQAASIVDLRQALAL